MRKFWVTSLLILSGFFLLSFTFGLFSSQSNSNSNVFSAANSFPTTEPTHEVTVTVTQNPTQTPSPTPQIANHVVISEVQINGAATTQDFVELYNPTNSSVDLSGWKLRKRISTGTESSLMVIPAGKSIAARGFFLWSNNSNDYNITVGADIANSGSIATDNSIALLKVDDSVMDRAGWGSGINQFVEGSLFGTNPSAGQSIERKANGTATSSSMSSGGSDEFKGNGFDTENNSTDFILRSLSQPQNSSSLTETP